MRPSRFTTTRITICLLLLLVAGACSDTTDLNGGEAQITLRAELLGNVVNAARKHSSVDQIARPDDVDSLHIHRMRLLLGDFVLHRSTIDARRSDRGLADGPIAVDLTLVGQSTELLQAQVPEGEYDNLMLAARRLAVDDAARYAGDADLEAFASNERLSIVIDGTVFDEGTWQEFSYRAAVERELVLEFDSPRSLAADDRLELVLQVDPLAFFRKGVSIFDPRLSRNRAEDEESLQRAISLRL